MGTCEPILKLSVASASQKHKEIMDARKNGRRRGKNASVPLAHTCSLLLSLFPIPF